MTESYLVRIYGDVEARIVHGPFDSNNISSELVAYFKKEPYDDRDGMFMLNIVEGKPSVVSFGSQFMLQCRHYADGTLND